MGKFFSKKDEEFDYLVSLPNNYPYETLLNGNISECVSVLQRMAKNPVFIPDIHRNLNLIKEDSLTAIRYEFILNKIWEANLKP